MRALCAALLLVPSIVAITRAADPPAPFVETGAVLLNVSEEDLNRIVVDAFHKNGGPVFRGERARVSKSVADLRYHARFSDPVIRLGKEGAAHLSLDILDASLRIGRLEGKIGGRMAHCEEAGLDMDGGVPLAVDVDFDLTVANGAFRLVPTSVEIPDARKRLHLIEPTRCMNSPFPRWFLWWLGKPYLRRSVDNLSQVALGRARLGAAELEAKGNLMAQSWELPKASLRLIPDSLDTSGGSLLFGLTASSAGPVSSSAPPRPQGGTGPRSSASFLGLSETFVNETARRVTSTLSISHRKSTGNFRKLLASDAVYALIPGLRTIGSTASVYFQVNFASSPQFEFRRLEAPPTDSSPNQALIRVLLSGVRVEVWKDEAGQRTLLGALNVDSGRMGVVPYMNPLGGISFRIVENDWQVSSTGLLFDEELVAATLQEITFGKVFATSYEPLLSRSLHLGVTEFVPRSFAVTAGYLVIGLAAPGRLETAPPVAAATRTTTLLGSR